MLEKIKLYGWQIVALLLVGLLAWCSLQRLTSAANNAKQVAILTNQLNENARVFTQLEASARTTSEAFRTLEKDYRDSIKTITDHSNRAITMVHTDADSARNSQQRMRSELASYIGSHRQAADARTTAGNCAPDPAPLDLLAFLFNSADERAGALAVVADEARARGVGCEQTYDTGYSLMQKAAAHVEAQ